MDEIAKFHGYVKQNKLQQTRGAKLFKGRTTYYFFLALAGHTILMKCLDNFYPESGVLPRFREGGRDVNRS